MKLPVLTKKRLQSIGIYRKLSEKQRKALKQGYLIEAEHLVHGQDPMIPYKISWDHIKEDLRYYDKLKKCKIH